MKRFDYMISLGLAIVIGGCALRTTQANTQAKSQAEHMAPAQVGIVNHTGDYIYSASVDGFGGGSMARWGAGMANMCCTSIPEVWRPGMKVSVRWNMPLGVKDVIKEKMVEVEKYDRPGDIYLNFFPNDEVRVVISRNGPRSSDYPIRHSGNPNGPQSSN